MKITKNVFLTWKIWLKTDQNPHCKWNKTECYGSYYNYEICVSSRRYVTWPRRGQLTLRNFKLKCPSALFVLYTHLRKRIVFDCFDAFSLFKDKLTVVLVSLRELALRVPNNWINAWLSACQEGKVVANLSLVLSRGENWQLLSLSFVHQSQT